MELDSAVHVLEAVCEELEYGRRLPSVHARLHSQLANAVGQSTTSSAEPDAFFSFKCEKAGPGAIGMDIPMLPQPIANTAAKKGWGFALWVRPTSPATFNTPSSGSTPAQQAREAVLVKLSSSYSGTETELYMRIGESRRVAAVIGLRTINSGGVARALVAASVRRAGSQVEVQTSGLDAGRWHHLAVSQTQPLIGIMKTPQLSIFLNGRKLIEQDNTCPPLPFVRAIIGGVNFNGDVAHPQLYSERLSPVHVSALFHRGPNMATLLHPLSSTTPSSAAPEILRAGLVTAASLDSLLEGQPLPATVAAVRGGKAGGDGASSSSGPGHAHVPAVLLYVSPLDCISTSNVIEGECESALSLDGHDGGGSGASRLLHHALGPATALVAAASSSAAAAAGGNVARPGSGSTSTIALRPAWAPLWWSRGTQYGDAASVNKKAVSAIVGSDVHMGAIVGVPGNADGMSGGELAGGQMRAIFGPSARVIIKANALTGSLHNSSALAQSTAAINTSGADNSDGAGGDTCLPITSQTWHSVGGVTRLLELIRVIPVGCGIDQDDAGGGSIEDTAAAHAADGFNTPLSPAATTSSTAPGTTAATAPAPVAAADLGSSALSSALVTLSILVKHDYNHREDMFQLRGFASLAQILRERHSQCCALLASATRQRYPVPLSQLPSASIRPLSVTHPVAMDVWAAVGSLLAAARQSGAARASDGSETWNPLFVRAARFMLCDWKVWTEPVAIVSGASTETVDAASATATAAEGAAANPSSSHSGSFDGAPADPLQSLFAPCIPVDPSAILGYSCCVSELVSSSPLDFMKQTGFDFQSACDAFAACLKSLSISILHAQLLEQVGKHPWLMHTSSTSSSQLQVQQQQQQQQTAFTGIDSSELPTPIQEAILFVKRLQAAGGVPSCSVADLCTKAHAVIENWMAVLHCLALIPLGISRRQHQGNIVHVQLQADPNRSAAMMNTLLLFVSRLCQDHVAFQAGQQSLLHLQNDLYIAAGQRIRALRQQQQHAAAAASQTEHAGAAAAKQHSIIPSIQPFSMAVVSSDSWDPFADACASGLDLVGRLIKNHPSKVHVPFENAKGTMTVTACAEADYERVRIAAINVLSAVIALRRTLNPRNYGESQPATGNARPVVAAAASSQGGAVQPPPVPGQPGGGAGTSSVSSQQQTQGVSSQQQQAAASFASMQKQAVLTAKDKQLRLLKVLWNTLLDRPNTTTASAIAALQLVLAPDIPAEGLGGGGSAGSGSGSRGASSAAGQSGGGVASSTSQGGGGRDRAGTSALNEDIGLSINQNLSSLTSATTITCPEGLPVVFLLLGQATARQQRRKRVAHLCRSSPWFPPSQVCARTGALPMEAVTVGLSKEAEVAANEAENSGRMRVVLDLSLLLKSRGSNAMAWMRQPGWQCWLLDLMFVPHLPKSQLMQHEGSSFAILQEHAAAGGGGTSEQRDRTRASSGDGRGGGTIAMNAGNASSVGSQSSVSSLSGIEGGGGSRDSATSTVAAIASDMLSTLVFHAMELENGSRVLVSTMAVLAERYRRDPKTIALQKAARIAAFGEEAANADSAKCAQLDQSILQGEISQGLAHVLSMYFDRLGREKPRLIPDLRANIIKMLRFACARLSGHPLKQVAIAALPVISWMRAAAALSSNSSSSSSGRTVGTGKDGGAAASSSSAAQAAAAASIPAPVVEPLRGQDLWTVLELLVRVLPNLVGYIHGWAPPNALLAASSASASTMPPACVGSLAVPQPGAFAEVISLLQGFMGEEVVTLHDPDQAAREAASMSSSVASSLAPATRSSIRGLTRMATNTQQPQGGGGGGTGTTPLQREKSTMGALQREQSMGIFHQPASTSDSSASNAASAGDQQPGQLVMTGGAVIGELGSRVDAIMYVLSGLQASMDAASTVMAIVELHKAGDATSLSPFITAPASNAGTVSQAAQTGNLQYQQHQQLPMEASLMEEGALSCQSMAMVLALSMVNNSDFGAWGHAIRHFRDEAYMRGKGRQVPIGGFRGNPSAAAIGPPSTPMVPRHPGGAAADRTTESTPAAASSSDDFFAVRGPTTPAATASTAFVPAVASALPPRPGAAVTDGGNRGISTGGVTAGMDLIDLGSSTSSDGSSSTAAAASGQQQSIPYDPFDSFMPPQAPAVAMHAIGSGVIDHGDAANDPFSFFDASFGAAFDGHQLPASMDAQPAPSSSAAPAHLSTPSHNSHHVPQSGRGRAGTLQPGLYSSGADGSTPVTGASTSTVQGTDVPPPPLDRTRAIFDALAPALRDIGDRMASESHSDFVELQLHRSQSHSAMVSKPVEATEAEPLDEDEADGYANNSSSSLRLQQHTSSGAELLSSPTVQMLHAAAVNDARPEWLKDMLIAETKPAPVNSVTALVDRTVLTSFRGQQYGFEAQRLVKVNGEVMTRSKMVRAHWTAVRIVLARHARIALRARRRAQALKRGDSSGSADGNLLVDDFAADDSKLASAAAGAASAVGAATPADTDVLEAVQIDSHENRSRLRSRLVLAKGEVLRAPTYVEYGRQGNASGSNTGGASSSATAAASAVASPASSTGDDLARNLAKAGAIKKVATSASNGTGTNGSADGAPAGDSDADDDDEQARREENALRAQASLDQQNKDGDADAGAKDDDGDDGEDAGSDAKSIAASSIRTIASTMGPGSGAASTAAPPVSGAGASGRPPASTETDIVVPDELSEVIEVQSSAATRASLLGQYRGVTANVLLVKPAGSAPGTLHLLPSYVLAWEPRGSNEPNRPDDPFAGPDPDSVLPPKRPRKWRIGDITAIFLRCYRLADSAVEIFVSAYGGPRRRRYFLVFENHAQRDDMVRTIVAAMPTSVVERLINNTGVSNTRSALDVSGTAGLGYGPAIYGSTSGNGIAFAYVQIPRSPPSSGGAAVGFSYNYEHHFRRAHNELVAAWKSRKLSNFDYLMAVNTLAGRSFNDLTQYPVFPWVLADYSSSSTSALDLTKPSAYRDLNRPMGALAGDRLREFRSRYSTFDDDMIPKFLYGSHFSTAVGTVVHYLLRLHPFTRLHVTYQSGHYDVADRLFSSISDAWSMNTSSLSEVKELMPEWYSSPHFLVNASRYRFGQLQSGEAVDNVRLPPWALSSPELFIRTMRSALESDWVSHAIHNWVDLVFGYKQRGSAAVAADNVFYYLTYAGGVDVDAITEPSLRRATQSQITHYGQTPLQLLKTPHAARGPYPTVPPCYIPPSPSSALALSVADTIAAMTTPQPMQQFTSLALLTDPFGLDIGGGSGGTGSDKDRSSGSGSGGAPPMSLSSMNRGPGGQPQRRTGGVGGALADMKKLVSTAAANVKTVGASVVTGAAAAATASGGSANARGSSIVGPLTPGLARPLAGELRRFADICALPTAGSIVADASAAHCPSSSMSSLSSPRTPAKQQGHEHPSAFGFDAFQPMQPSGDGFDVFAAATAADRSPATPLSTFDAALPSSSSPSPLFTLHLNRGFTHLCTASTAGVSFWRPDTPSPLPIGIHEVYGPFAGMTTMKALVQQTIAARSIGVAPATTQYHYGSGSGRSSPAVGQDAPVVAAASTSSACVVCSLGDVCVVGSAPPPAAMSVRVPLSALEATIDVRTGREATPWPTDDVPANPSSAGAAGVVVGSTRPKPFALPIRYLKLMELAGASAASTLGSASSSASSSFTSSKDAAFEALVEGLPAAVAAPGGDASAAPNQHGQQNQQQRHVRPSATLFHVWWPVAPAGYAAMGCVITPANVVRYLREEVDGGPGGTGGAASTSDAASSPAAASGASAQGASRGEKDRAQQQQQQVRWTVVTEIRPNPPSPDAIVCVHVSLLHKSQLAHFIPLPWMAISRAARGSSLSSRHSHHNAGGLSSFNLSVDSSHGGGGGAMASALMMPGATASTMATPRQSPLVTPANALAASAADSLDWFVPVEQLGTAAGAASLSTASPRPTGSLSGRGGDIDAALSGLVSPITPSDAGSAALPSAGDNDDASAAADLELSTTSIGSIIASETMSNARVAEFRASNSSGCALYTVGNKAGTFVLPVPLSAHRQTLPSTSAAPTNAPSSIAAAGDTEGEFYLAPTRVPSVPEHADATYHRAHAYASAVSYEFAASVLLSHTENDVSCSLATTTGTTAAGSTIGAVGVSPQWTYSDQHWTADAASTGVVPARVVLRHTPYGPAVRSATAGTAASSGHSSGTSSSVGGKAAASDTLAATWDFSCVHSLPVPRSAIVRRFTHDFTSGVDGMSSSATAALDYSFASLPDVEALLKPAVVCVRILSSAAAVAAASSLGLPTSSAHTMHILNGIQPQTVVTIDAKGIIDRFHVASQAVHPPEAIIDHVDTAAATAATVKGLEITSAPAAALHPFLANRMSQRTLSHVRIRIVRAGPDIRSTVPESAQGLPHVPLRNYKHRLPLMTVAVGASASAGAAIGARRCSSATGGVGLSNIYSTGISASQESSNGFDDDIFGLSNVGTMHNAGQSDDNAFLFNSGNAPAATLDVMDPQRLVLPSLTTYPAALADLVCGGFVVTGSGRGHGLTSYALDVRDRSSSSSSGAAASSFQQAQTNASTGVPGTLPLVPFGPKRSAASNAANIGRSVLSTVAGAAASSLVSVPAGGEGSIDVPSWAGSGSLMLAGSMSITTSRPTTATAVAIDNDVLCIGNDDGSVCVWRMGGLEILSSLTVLPSAKTRPDVLIRGPGCGAVTSLSVCRDADTLIVGYLGQAWVYELSRGGRPLQHVTFPVPTSPAAAAASALPPVSGGGGSVYMDDFYAAAASVAAGYGGGAASSSTTPSTGPSTIVITPPVCTGACTTSDGGFAIAYTSYLMCKARGFEAGDEVTHAGPAISEVVLFGSKLTAGLDPQPLARTGPIHARITCLSRVRGGGTGDWEGPGALIAVGRSDGVITIYDACSAALAPSTGCSAQLRELCTWMSPQRSPVHCIDVSPCTGYLVAGCANGLVAAFALPAFAVTVPVPPPEAALTEDGLIGNSGGADASSAGPAGHSGDGTARGSGASSSSTSAGAGGAVAQAAADAAKGISKSAKAIFGSIFRK